MNSERPGRAEIVIGPTGKPLTIDDIRKAEVAASVRHGLIGLDEACERYRLSAEEFLNWEQVIAAHGLRGLRATRTQEYRQSERDDNPGPRARAGQIPTH